MMDTQHTSVGDANGSTTTKMLPTTFTSDTEKVEEDIVDGEESSSEMKALLPPKENPMSRKAEKKTRKVRWNDTIGNNLAEVLEFQPSDPSDSDDEDDSCVCSIM